MSWLTDLVNQHSEFESPKSFWFWAGLSAISAVVKDQVWMDCFVYKLYPNIYVMLHADSGLKKGPPVNLARDLVRRVNNTRIISGRSSIQGILKKLGEAYTVKGAKPIMKSVGFIVASEFSSSLVNDPAAMTILTDLYDRNYNTGEWESLLKQESFNLKDPTVSLFVATNKAHFDDFIAAKDIHGGFVGRMFVILEKEVNKLNPLIKPPSTIPDRDELSLYLKELSKLSGPFETLEGTEAGEMYESWYTSFYTTVVKERIDDPTGTINRIGDSVKKVAMLLSLAESPDKIITTQNMEEAILVCQGLIASARQSTLGKQVKENQDTARKSLLLTELLERPDHKISRSDLLKRFWMHGNADEWATATESLIEGGLIETEQRGKYKYYVMTDEMIEFMRSS